MKLILSVIAFCLCLPVTLCSKETSWVEAIFKYYTYQADVLAKGIANTDICRGQKGSMANGALTFDEFYTNTAQKNGFKCTTTAGSKKTLPLDADGLINELRNGNIFTRIDDRKVVAKFSKFPNLPDYSTTMSAYLDLWKDAPNKIQGDAAKAEYAKVKDNTDKVMDGMEKLRQADWQPYLKTEIEQQLRKTIPNAVVATTRETYGGVTWDQVNIKATAQNNAAKPGAAKIGDQDAIERSITQMADNYGKNSSGKKDIAFQHRKALDAAKDLVSSWQKLC